MTAALRDPLDRSVFGPVSRGRSGRARCRVTARCDAVALRESEAADEYTRAPSAVPGRSAAMSHSQSERSEAPRSYFLIWQFGSARRSSFSPVFVTGVPTR